MGKFKASVKDGKVVLTKADGEPKKAAPEPKPAPQPKPAEKKPER